MTTKNSKDHQQLGRELELFFTHEIAPGAPFWLPRGMVIFKELEKYIRDLTEKVGYQETSTPIMVKSELFKQSGHWEKFGKHNMYNLALYEDEEIEELNKQAKSSPVNYTLKPMNCPESTVIYRFKPRSYKDLPLRFSEIGRLHRREKSGEINGLFRVRQLTMDDAHLYVREDQIMDEVSQIIETMITFYKSFGFEYEFKLATRPEQFAGTVENWGKAEKILQQALKSKNLGFSIKEKEGAFYGPKIDVNIKDALGREWQLATVQLDFSMPEAFDLKYVDADGKNKRPIIIHRAVFGSFERFIAILTEHFQGAFPTWLAPVQVAVIPISERHIDYAQKVQQDLVNQDLRAEIDERNETMQAKIREATLQKIPYMVIIGDKEIEESEKKKEKIVSVRTRKGENLGQVTLTKFLKDVWEEIRSKSSTA